MTNRYTQLSFNSLNDLPQLQLPYEQLDNLLGEQQGKIDLLNASTNLIPKYIQQSEDDRLLAGQIMKYQQDVKNQLAEIAKTGNVNTYMEALNQAQNQIKRLYQPGGAADVLQQRYNQDEAEKKRLLEFYKDRPDWANHAIQTRQYNKVGYNPSTGEYNPVNSFGNTPTYISAEKRNEWFNKNLDNIKNSILYDENGKERKGINKHQLDNISSVYDFWNIEGVPYERLVNIFTSIFPKEFQESMYHDEKVNKFYAGDNTPIDTNILIEDEKGNIKLNPKNRIAKEISGYAVLGERYNKMHNYQRNQDEEKLKRLESQLRREEEKEKQGVFRLEGQSIGFNPDVLPKDIDGLKEATTSTVQQISRLQEELKTTNDPQRQQYILSQIKWQDAIKQKQENLMTQAREATKPTGYDQFMKQYGFDKMTPQQLIEFTMGVESKAGGDMVDQVLAKGGKPITIKEAQNVLRQYKEYKADAADAQDKWLEENADNTNFQLGTISLAPEERTAIKASLNTDSWTFFDEKGVILNEEKGSIFGTKKKPIISDNVEVGGITKHPFGDFGNLVTLTDANGKVYYGSMNNGNVGKAIGNTIKNKAPEGSDQWLLGEMISNPSISNTLGQMTDMKFGDTRTIVSGTNTLGKVNKRKEESGNIVYIYTAPDGVVLDKQGSKTKEFNNVTDLALSMESVNTALSTQKSK